MNSAGRIADPLVRDCPALSTSDRVHDAVRAVLDSGLPALPVLDRHGRLRGIVGEREFFAALFPGYLQQLGYAGFVPRAVDNALDKHAACRDEPVAAYMNTDHVDVDSDVSDAQLAEVFLHRRVLIIPVLDDGRLVGVITRADFLAALAQRFLARAPSAQHTGPTRSSATPARRCTHIDQQSARAALDLDLCGAGASGVPEAYVGEQAVKRPG